MPNLFRHPTSPALPNFSYKTNKLVILSDSEGSILEGAWRIPALGRGMAAPLARSRGFSAA
nr:hypothetical protein [Mucilaginibacter sp. SP1R1]